MKITFLIAVAGVFPSFISFAATTTATAVGNESDWRSIAGGEGGGAKNALEGGSGWGDAQFLNGFSKWNIWDRPEDQVATEQQQVGTRKGKKKSSSSTKKSGSDSISIVGSKREGHGHGGCAGGDNVQVQFYPIVLVLIAAITGLITIVVLWFIATRWGGALPVGGGGGYSTGGGWGSARQISTDFPGFLKLLKKIDLDQLTNLVLSGIEG